MDLQNVVTLSVDGRDYRGWKTVSITAGIEQQARTFTLGVSWRWPGEDMEVPVKQGAPCEIRIGADLVLTGHVYSTPISYDANSVTRSVAGRSLTADLVDCAATGSSSQWKKQSVQVIVQALAAPYGVEVLSEVAKTFPVKEHVITPGETVFESIDKLLTLSRLFSTDDGKGHLVIVAPGSSGRAVDRLELGKNILSGSAQKDYSAVFSEYLVTGQRKREDGEPADKAAQVKATALDDIPPRKRLKHIHEQSQLTQELAQSRADWERASRKGKALTRTYKIQGWRQSNGDLWRENMIVRIVDRLLGDDQDMLISQIQYDLGESGTTAELTVAPIEAFLPEPKGLSKAT